MKVYTLEGHVKYQGYDVVGIYSSIELAQAALTEKQKKGRTYIDWYDITEHELDAGVSGA